MMRTIPTFRTQFGDGFQPPTDSAYTPAGTGQDEIIGSVVKAVSNGLGILTVLAGLFFIFYFLLGGLQWVTSGGDSGKVTKARDQMLHGVIGLTIIVLSYSLIALIGDVLGIEILDLQTNLEALIPGP